MIFVMWGRKSIKKKVDFARIIAKKLKLVAWSNQKFSSFIYLSD